MPDTTNEETMTKSEELTKQIEANQNTATPLPAYRCHKEVWALKIKEIVPAPLAKREIVVVFSQTKGVL